MTDDIGDYLYRLTVYTGLKRNAGTKSKVYVNIEGIHGGSGIWKLDPTPHTVNINQPIGLKSSVKHYYFRCSHNLRFAFV